MDIPEYYRQFQNTPKDEKKTDKPPQVKEDQKLPQKQEPKKDEKPPQVKDKTIVYTGNGFTLNQLEDWEDKTIYTITGPVTDGIQHNVIITLDRENPFDTLEEFAEWHIKTMETDLKGCTLLKKGETKLTNGTDAYEAIFSWYPSDQLKIYQHQIFVQFEKTVYKMTASFTKKTRDTLGPQVLRMMLSLNLTPIPPK
jgi:hypothetical protein